MGTDPIDPATILDHNIGIYECLTNEEKKASTVGLRAALDRASPGAGADFFALFSEAEAACRDNLSEEQLAAIVVSQPLQTASKGSTVSRCIEPETNLKVFTSGIQWAIGGVSEESLR